MLLTVDAREASLMRALLDRFASEGVTYTERRHWLFWRRFCVSGPAEAVSVVAERARAMKWQLWLDRVTPGRSYETP